MKMSLQSAVAITHPGNDREALFVCPRSTLDARMVTMRCALEDVASGGNETEMD